MSDERTTMEADAIERFVSGYFPEEFVAAGLDSLSPDEREYLLERADHHFDSSKGTLGLALDFLLVAEGLSALDGRLNEFEPELTQQDIFERYEKADRGATLTLKYGDEQFGIRPVHNEVIDLFREELGRTNFPSSPGHHTGEWSRYQEMLETKQRFDSLAMAGTRPSSGSSISVCGDWIRNSSRVASRRFPNRSAASCSTTTENTPTSRQGRPIRRWPTDT
jgi:hypothetical protein